MSEIVPTTELDCRGLTCPVPALKTKKAISGLAAGEILKVISTDPGSIADMESFSQMTGHEILDKSENDGEFVFYFRKV